MPSKEDFLGKKPTFKAQVNGLFGSGKTRFGFTFPKIFYIGTEPAGIENLRQPENKPLLDNLIEYEMFLPSDDKEVKQQYEPDKGSIYLSCLKAKEMAKKGEVETLFIDNLSYFAEKAWMYISLFDKQYSAKTGNVDTQAMYGSLGRNLFKFVSMYVANFPGNVIIACHLKRESDEAMEGKLDKSADISPNIVGGFRNVAEGLFGASIYLDRELQADGKTSKFIAYCQKSKVNSLGSVVNAKNVYGLPARVENVSYQVLMDAVANKGGSNGK